VAKQKLTKRVVETAARGDKDYEIRDTEVHGFLCKVTPAGNKVFMAQYRTWAGVRRKPKIGQPVNPPAPGLVGCRDIEDQLLYSPSAGCQRGSVLSAWG
jgi:hypothetical protein